MSTPEYNDFICSALSTEPLSTVQNKSQESQLARENFFDKSLMILVSVGVTNFICPTVKQTVV
jgi:hypothetical protein